MWTAPLDPAAALYIVLNMREWDRREIYATRWTDCPNELTDSTLEAAAVPGAVALMAGLGKPIAALGAVPVSPGVYSVWCYGTDEFPLLGYSLTRLVKKCIIPQLISAGLHRGECLSIEGHADAQRWLRRLGFVQERTLKDRGRNRETFHAYAWRLSDHKGAG